MSGPDWAKHMYKSINPLLNAVDATLALKECEAL